MSPPIYVLPGMGADRRMYPGPWRDLPDVQFIDWHAADAATSVTELAACVRERAGMTDDCVLIGSSLGGMVAAELCKLVRVRHLFLVGSAIHPDEVGVLMRAAAPMARVVPFRAAQEFVGNLGGELFQMFHASDPDFMRRMCRAIVTWSGYTRHGERLHRIHGTRDVIIPAPATADLLLDAGHLLAMTNPSECVQFIRARLGLDVAQATIV